MEIKTKINKWSLINFKSFCTTKETINKAKRQPTYREEVFANDAIKGLISKINKQHIQLNIKISKQPNQKIGRRINKHFSKEDIQLASSNMKRCPLSLIIREMQIKTTMRYYLTPLRKAVIKKSTNIQCWRQCGEKGTLLHCWWE